MSPLAATRGRYRFFHTQISDQEIKLYQMGHESSKKMQKILADTLGLGRARNVNNKVKKSNSQLMISLNEISNSDNCFHDVDYQGQKVLFL